MPFKQKIATIIGNQSLATAINNSVTSALECPYANLFGKKTVWGVFKQSLNAAIRDIEEHPRGKLFRRLIEYGPPDPDDPPVLVSDEETILSDPECGTCVEFIFSHMVNRFKGELAELLALEPCIKLVRQFQKKGRLPSDIHLYWGEAVQERRRLKNSIGEYGIRWGNFSKGADGLLVEKTTSQANNDDATIKIHSIIEIKSMKCNRKKVIHQINNHIFRLNGGLRLNRKGYPPKDLVFKNSRIIRIMVMPSTRKLSRDWNRVQGRLMILSEPSDSLVKTQVEEIASNLWSIKLEWSQEALSEAAYEMTFWYMSQVGRHVYARKSMPKGWENMTSEDGGFNAIKMMLYYILLRPISKRQERLAIKLYNVYCFGYPLGSDSKEMLWPEDFPE